MKTMHEDEALMNAEQYVKRVRDAAAMIRQQIGQQPEMGLILGSGLGDLAEQIENPVTLDYEAIPHFPVSTVEGHAGRFVFGKLQGKWVLAMQGRIHYYEGYSMREAVFPIYVMHELGIQMLVITNAAGGMNKSFAPGDLMLISDHINYTGQNPLIGENAAEWGPRFPDMSGAYSVELRMLAKKIGSAIQGDDGKPLRLQEGVYCGISGPNYSTPAESTLLAWLGGDAIGMSTVGEVIAARHCGMKVLGISCITDMAIGESLEPLTHEQVVAVAEQTKPKFMKLVKAFIEQVRIE